MRLRRLLTPRGERASRGADCALTAWRCCCPASSSLFRCCFGYITEAGGGSNSPEKKRLFNSRQSARERARDVPAEHRHMDAGVSRVVSAARWRAGGALSGAQVRPPLRESCVAPASSPSSEKRCAIPKCIDPTQRDDAAVESAVSILFDTLNF